MAHGDKWRAFAGEHAVDIWLPRVTQGAKILPGREREFSSQAGSYRAKPLGMYSSVGAFGLFAIVVPEPTRNGYLLATAYPFPLGATTVRLTVDEVVEDCDGLEAYIRSGVNELSLSFFATDYLIRADHYAVGAELDISLAAFAYTLAEAVPQEISLGNLDGIQLPDGVELPNVVSTKGMAALFPIAGWDPCDYSFQGPLLRRLDEEADHAILDVTVARLDNTDFDLRLTATKHALRDASLAPGADLSGALCLMGCIADSDWPPPPQSEN